MRRWPVLLAFVLGVLLTGTLLAQTPGVNVVVDDTTLPPGAGQILEGRTWIRLRSFEAAGYVVLWDDATHTARIGRVRPTPTPSPTITATASPSPTSSPTVTSSPVPSPIPTGVGLRFNVRDYGAVPDDGQDDTVAVHAAIAAAPNDQRATIYFPAGTYVVNNDTVESRSGLTFSGDGFTSILQRPPLGGNTRILTFISSNHLVIRDLAFDEHGIQNYGGVNFFSVTDVLIENTRHFDSTPAPIPGGNWTDRYSYVFGHGGTPSQDIVIRNNTIEWLQLEVDFAQRVTIIDNTVTRSCCTAGIGGFSLFSGALMEDYVIERNTITDPRNGGTGSAGIIFDLDPANTNNVTVRRVRIANNSIIRHSTNNTGILIGTPNNSVSTTGNAFDDITIDGNTFTTDVTAPSLPEDTAGIKFNNHPATTNILMRRITIQNNVMSGVSTAMDLRFLQRWVVQNNQILGRGSLINFADGFRDGQARNNVIEAGPNGDNIPYWWQHSGGGNTFTGNRFLGVPLEEPPPAVRGLRIADSNGTDTIEPPTLQTASSGPLVAAAMGLGALGLWARQRFQPKPVRKRRKREGKP